MGSMIIKIKIMPSSLEANLEKIKEKASKTIEELGGGNSRFEEEAIAFGLKAIITLFVWPEEQELEDLEEQLKKIENVSSVQIIDMRRAI